MLERPTADDIRRVAEEWHFSVSPDELPEYLDLADYIMTMVDGLEGDLGGGGPAGPGTARDQGARLTAEDDPLNAIVRRCSVRGTGTDGLLRGKSIALKDNISIAGVPLTGASSVLQEYVPTKDATVVSRILAAGGEIVAVTNMDLLSCSAGGESSIYGPTHNPFDPARSAGGSSSGSAACLYYDWIDIALGCDQGGSIRLPAAWCGVIGLKPTHSLVPYTGIIGLDATLDFCGPMGRTVEDVAALLQVVAGSDGHDPRQCNVSAEDYVGAVTQAQASLEGWRVGVIAEGISEGVGITPGMASATMRFTDRLAKLGAVVTTTSIPEHLAGGPVAFDAYSESLAAVLGSGGNGYQLGGRLSPDLALQFGAGLARSAQRLSPQVKILLMMGTFLNQTYHGALYAAGQNRKEGLRRPFDAAFEQFDVLVTPTAPWVAHGLRPDAAISEHVKRGWDNLSNTSIFDLTGHPALTIPAEQDEGLPAGMQLIGPRFKDARLLAMARTYEEGFGWAPGSG